MPRRTWSALRFGFAAAATALVMLGVSGCGGEFIRQYEYEEEIYLAVDGSATVNVNASVAALVNLRGLSLDTNPVAVLDSEALRRAYDSPVARVTRVNRWRRFGRRFVQVRLEVSDIRKLSQAPLFAWSAYQLDQTGDMLIYRQHLGAGPIKPVGDVGWSGGEFVAVRIHVPSRIKYHNAGADNLKRGNILVWEQTLTDRQAGKPIEIEARMERTSILYSTLLLFAVSGGLALLVMGIIIYWVMKKAKGRIKQ